MPFMTFLVEYPLDLVAYEGNLLADNAQRVETAARSKKPLKSRSHRSFGEGLGARR